ncbi:hypothetical protein Tco_0063801 [Tanacetum coccineum]
MPRTRGNFDDEAGSSRSKRTCEHETMEEALLPQVYHPFLLWEGLFSIGLLNKMGCREEIEEMLEIKVIEMGGDEEMLLLKLGGVRLT